MLRDVVLFCKVLLAVVVPCGVIAADTCDEVGKCSCEVGQYQEALLVPSCLGRTCSVNFDMVKSQTKNYKKIVTLLADMEDVELVLTSADADMDIQLKDEDGRCILGALCTPPAGLYQGTEACTVGDEEEECILYGGMTLYFSGDDRNVPIEEEIRALSPLTQNLSVTVAAWDGIGTVTLSNAPLANCPTLLPGCRPCSDYTGCAEGIQYPVCTGCSEVTCVDITYTTSTSTQTSRTLTTSTATSITITETSITATTTATTSITVTRSTTTTTATKSVTTETTSTTQSSTGTTTSSTLSQTTSTSSTLAYTLSSTSTTSKSSSTSSTWTSSSSTTTTTASTTTTGTITATSKTETSTSTSTDTISITATSSTSISSTSTGTSTTSSTVSTQSSTSTISTATSSSTSSQTASTSSSTTASSTSATTTSSTQSSKTQTSTTQSSTTKTGSTVTTTRTFSTTTTTSTCACCQFCQAPVCMGFSTYCAAAFPEVQAPGTALLTVDEPVAFVADLYATAGVKAAIAKMVEVSPAALEVTLSVARRLAARRLAGSVLVDYDLKLPADDPAEAQSQSQALLTKFEALELNPGSLSAAIEEEIVEAGGQSYMVTVNSFTKPDTFDLFDRGFQDSEDSPSVSDNVAAFVPLLATGVVLLFVEVLIAFFLFRVGWLRPSHAKGKTEKDQQIVPVEPAIDDALHKAQRSLYAEESHRRSLQQRNQTLTQKVASLTGEITALAMAKAKEEEAATVLEARLSESQKVQRELEHQLMESRQECELQAHRQQELMEQSEHIRYSLEQELQELRKRLKGFDKEQAVFQQRAQEKPEVMPTEPSAGYGGMTPRDVEQVQLAVAQSLHNEIANTYRQLQQRLEQEKQPSRTPSPRRPPSAPASSSWQTPLHSEPIVAPPAPPPLLP